MNLSNRLTFSLVFSVLLVAAFRLHRCSCNSTGDGNRMYRVETDYEPGVDPWILWFQVRS